MRIAISGTHRTGKSTLIEALQKEMPGYTVFDEPYWILTELGRHFSDPPTIEEFEEQLQYSIDLIKKSPRMSLFDRCPMDFLCYAIAIAEMNFLEFDSDKWESRVSRTLSLLDLIIFLPLESPDRIFVPTSEDPYFRSLVNEKLQEMLIENTHQMMTTKVLEITGTVSERVKKIKKCLLSLKTDNR